MHCEVIGLLLMVLSVTYLDGFVADIRLKSDFLHDRLYTLLCNVFKLFISELDFKFRCVKPSFIRSSRNIKLTLFLFSKFDSFRFHLLWHMIPILSIQCVEDRQPLSVMRYLDWLT